TKAARDGVRAASMRSPERFGELVWNLTEAINEQLVGTYDADPLDPQEVARTYREAARELAPYLVDVVPFINQALREGKSILAEGGQATLLDIDHGNYPFVTSSNPTVGGAMVGLGFGPKYVERVIGVAKA